MNTNSVDDAPPRIDPTALVEDTATVGSGSVIWGLTQIRAGARVGSQCVVGRGAFIDTDVVVGDRCKIQNSALLYAPARVGDGVFVGPAVVFTNDSHPRAVNVDGSSKSSTDWSPVGVTVMHGASIGARAVCVAPVTIGAWAVIAAGAVVVKDVPPHALMVGMPARQVAWVGRAGHRLISVGNDRFACPFTGEAYTQTRDGELVREA
jgi:UDP-2-acetamido-3-amino-2,3-dideoxy-glucuronate N-acetyltransferase